jgi:hypothetical protein
MSFLYVIIHYTTQLLICQPLFTNSFLRFRRNTSKYPDLRYRETLLSITPQAQVIGRGSSGIATLATALDAKYAGCHTPRRPCPQWFDLKYRMGVVSRAAVGAPSLWSVCRSASLILTSILYHKGSDLSIPFSNIF